MLAKTLGQARPYSMMARLVTALTVPNTKMLENQDLEPRTTELMVPAEGDSSLLQHQCHIQCRQYQQVMDCQVTVNRHDMYISLYISLLLGELTPSLAHRHALYDSRRVTDRR